MPFIQANVTEQAGIVGTVTEGVSLTASFPAFKNMIWKCLTLCNTAA